LADLKQKLAEGHYDSPWGFAEDFSQIEENVLALVKPGKEKQMVKQLVHEVSEKTDCVKASTG